MKWIELIRLCQGDKRLDRFSQEIGLGHSTLGMIVAGERKPGPRVVRALIAACPERREQIMEVFLSGNGYR